MRLTSFVSESINDKGIFKALFVAGFPGSGKTTLIKKVHDGSLPVMQVNSDIWTEYYMKFDRRAWSDIGKLVKRHSLSNVYFNLNSLLPLYVDSTGTNPDLFKNRVTILKEFGYDLKMIMIDVELQTSKNRAIKRAEGGGRRVDLEYIDKAYTQIKGDIGMYKKYIPNYKTIRNNDGEFTPEFAQKLSNEVFSFFSSSVSNDRGREIINFMKKNGYKYYNDIPDDIKKEKGWFILDRRALNWY